MSAEGEAYPDGAGAEPDGLADGELTRGSRSKTADPGQLARDTVYRLLAARARGRSELQEALRRKGIDDEVADSVLRKFDDAGLVDDAAFAESWVRERHENQGLGRTALRAELRRKGVSEETIAEALTHVDGDAEVTRARTLIQRKLRGTATSGTGASAKDRDRIMRRLVAMLARKGYSEGLALRLVKEELDQAGVDSTDTDAMADPDGSL